MREFLAMGGYGFYIWLAYGVAVVVLGMNVIKPWFDFKLIKRQLS